MKKLSHRLNDIKFIDSQATNISVVSSLSNTDKVYNEIVESAYSNPNIIKGLELQRINTLLSTTSDLSEFQINQLQLIKKRYESN